MPAESKIAHFFTFEKKQLHCYKQKYNQKCYIYIPQIGHNATFYLKIKLHKYILNRFSFDFMQKKIETVDRSTFEGYRDIKYSSADFQRYRILMTDPFHPAFPPPTAPPHLQPPHPLQASPFLMQANEYAFSLLSLGNRNQPINALGPCKTPRIPHDFWVMYYVRSLW